MASHPEPAAGADDDTNIVDDDTALVAPIAVVTSLDDALSGDRVATDEDESTVAIEDNTVVVEVNEYTVDVDGDTVSVADDTNPVDDATIAVARDSSSKSRSTREKSRTRRKAAQEALARRRGLTPPPLPGGRVAEAIEAPGPGSLESYAPRKLAPVSDPPEATSPDTPVTHRQGSIASVRKSSRRYARAAMAALTVSWMGAIAAGVWIVWYLTRA